MPTKFVELLLQAPSLDKSRKTWTKRAKNK